MPTIVWLSEPHEPYLARAADELARYLRLLEAQDVQVVHETPASMNDVIAVGTASSLGAMSALGSCPTFASGYRVFGRSRNGIVTGGVVGADHVGALYGAYAFLEQLGVSFHLHGDNLAPGTRLPERAAFDISRAPRFALRGTQLWCFWHAGRDCWGWSDYEAYLEQLPKMGMNLFDFPLYFYEPLYTNYSYLGVRPEGHYLAGVDTTLVRIGSKFVAAKGRYTSPDIPEDRPAMERSQAAIELMRKVFRKATGLGISTCVGIELSNLLLSNPELLQAIPESDRYEDGLLISPTSASARGLTRARLTALVDAYPDCDYYAIWQPEIGVFRDTKGSPHPADVAFRTRHDKHAAVLTPGDYDYVQWLLLAHQVMKDIKPDAKLVTGGWGVDRIMAAADDLLPTEMVRSMIGYYEPQVTLKQGKLDSYGRTSGPKWHTTWAEVDQHLWVLQPKTRMNARILDELEAKRVDAALLLHWRNLFVDLDASLFAKGCWTGTGSRDDRLRHWIVAKFGDKALPEIVAAVDTLEEFNTFTSDIDHIEEAHWWVGYDCYIGGLLVGHRYLCDDGSVPNTWLRISVEPLMRHAPRAIELLEAASRSAAAALDALDDHAARARWSFYENRTRFTRDLYICHHRLAEALTIYFRRDRQTRADREAAAAAALHLMQACEPEAVVRLFCESMGEDAPEKGEIGLLLSLNYKFVASFRRIEARLRRLAGLLPPMLVPSPESRLFVKCGANMPRRVYERYSDRNGLRPERWSLVADETVSEAGFAYLPTSEIEAAMQNADVGCWRHPELVAATLTVPGDFSGRLRVYLLEDPDWDVAFRRQEVIVDGVSIGTFNDFHGRGAFWDEGIWVETEVQADPAMSAKERNVELEVRRRGTGDVRVACIELVAR